MIKQFEGLSEPEMGLLLKAPILVSVLAATWDHEIGNEEKADAIKLAHLKTFSADPVLIQYYKEVDKNFKDHFESIVKQFSPFDEAMRDGLRLEITRVNSVISKLDPKYARTLQRSLGNYAEHVKKSYRRIVENFIFPLPIPGLTE